MTPLDDAHAAALTLGALARSHRRFRNAERKLGDRPDVLEARLHLHFRPLDGAGAQVEVGVEATLERPGRTASWYLAIEWVPTGWTVAAHAVLNVRGHFTALRPTARWSGTAAAAFSEVAERAAAGLVADVGTVALVEPPAALAATAARIAGPPEQGPPAILGVPRADLVRAYVLDGMAESDAEQHADEILASGGLQRQPNGVTSFLGWELLVPLARLGPPLSDALCRRLEEAVGEHEAELVELRPLLERVRAITPPEAR